MGKRVFFTGAAPLISDGRLSALDWRVYACVSLHDGMSLVKGRGSGCYASNQTLARLVGCDYSNVSKSLKRLVEWGYLIKDRRDDDRRTSSYRAVFAFPEGWRDDQQLRDEKVGETANHSPAIVGRSDNNPPEVVGETANKSPKVVGQSDKLSSGKQNENPAYYIPLKGELYSVETEGLDSVETARMECAAQVADPDIHPLQDLFTPEDGDEDLLGRGSMPEQSRNVGGELAQLERNLRRNPSSVDLEDWIPRLEDLAEDADDTDDPTAHRARRLLEEFDPDGGSVLTDLFEAGRSTRQITLEAEAVAHEPEVADGELKTRAFAAELDQFECAFGRASSALDLDAWAVRLEKAAADDELSRPVRARAERLVIDIRERRARASAASNTSAAVEADGGVTDEIRRRLTECISQGVEGALEHLARLTSVPLQKLQDFAAGAPLSSKHSVAVRLKLAAMEEFARANGGAG